MQRTLEEIMPLVRELPVFDRLKLVRMLIDELEQPAEDISPFEPYKTYYIYTPAESYGAGKTLMDALNAESGE